MIKLEGLGILPNEKRIVLKKAWRKFFNKHLILLFTYEYLFDLYNTIVLKHV